MASSKNRELPSKLTDRSRHRPESPRQRFLWADVTQKEHDEIRAYCRQRGTSVSQFLADLVLRDAVMPPRKNQQVILRPKIKLTAQQHDKLEVLARLHQKKSVGEFILDVLVPELELQRIHVPVKKKMLRYYLTETQHRVVTDHIASSGLSATNYTTLLALRAIHKDAKARK
jgi:hypothetical protein